MSLEKNTSVKVEWDSIAEIVRKVKNKESSALSNVEKSLELIEKLNPEYKFVISTCRDRAIGLAKFIDEKIDKGENVGSLAGVPFIAKDNFLVFGSMTTAASNILKNFDPPYQSSAIDRLESEGAICVAKANLDAFAHGSSTENSDFFTTRNPYDVSRVPGGSSGGSATAVSLGVVPFALGTDTGGSIRLPASYCGVVGYKPTYGLISRSGVVAMASSTDVIGPFTKDTFDCSIVLDVMSGKDGLDSTMIERQDSYLLNDHKGSLKGKRFGLIKEYMEGLDISIKKTVEKSVEQIRNSGGYVEEISLPSLPLALAVYYVVVPAEVSSNLSRYDGQRYGYSEKNVKNLDESYELSRSNGLGQEAKRRIMIGTHVLSSGYYDAYYKKAQTVRTKIIAEFREAFEKFDFLLGPTAPNIAFKIGENVDDPLAMYLTDIMTVAVNLAGIPAISIPNGMVEGMPVGLQIMADQKRDKQLLQVAHIYEELVK